MALVASVVSGNVACTTEEVPGGHCGPAQTYESVVANIHVTGGSVTFRGRNLLSLPPRARRALCGRHVGMIFQDPLSALNPVFTVGWQLSEMYRVHEAVARREADERAINFDEVNLGFPEQIALLEADR